MKKKITSAILFLLVLWLTAMNSCALGEFSVCSTSVFRTKNLKATTAGVVTFTASLKEKGDISVTSCSVECWNGAKWHFVKTLPVPDGQTGIRKYSVSKDYANSLTKGNTYRFKATYVSSGEKVSIVSNTITY